MAAVPSFFEHFHVGLAGPWAVVSSERPLIVVYEPSSPLQMLRFLGSLALGFLEVTTAPLSEKPRVAWHGMHGCGRCPYCYSIHPQRRMLSRKRGPEPLSIWVTLQQRPRHRGHGVARSWPAGWRERSSSISSNQKCLPWCRKQRDMLDPDLLRTRGEAQSRGRALYKVRQAVSRLARGDVAQNNFSCRWASTGQRSDPVDKVAAEQEAFQRSKSGATGANWLRSKAYRARGWRGARPVCQVYGL